MHHTTIAGCALTGAGAGVAAFLAADIAPGQPVTGAQLLLTALATVLALAGVAVAATGFRVRHDQTARTAGSSEVAESETSRERMISTGDRGDPPAPTKEPPSEHHAGNPPGSGTTEHRPRGEGGAMQPVRTIDTNDDDPEDTGGWHPRNHSRTRINALLDKRRDYRPKFGLRPLTQWLLGLAAADTLAVTVHYVRGILHHQGPSQTFSAHLVVCAILVISALARLGHELDIHRLLVVKHQADAEFDAISQYRHELLMAEVRAAAAAGRNREWAGYAKAARDLGMESADGPATVISLPRRQPGRTNGRN